MSLLCYPVSPPPRSAYRHRQRGFSLIEAAIVLAVVGAVIGGIWWAAAAVSRSHQKQQFLQGLLSIQTNAARYLPQTLPPGNGMTLANSIFYPSEFYQLVFPDEWDRIELYDIVETWLDFEIVSDSNDIRFLKVGLRFHTQAFCDEVAAYATARKLIISNACTFSAVTHVLWITFDMPRRD